MAASLTGKSARFGLNLAAEAGNKSPDNPVANAWSEKLACRINRGAIRRIQGERVRLVAHLCCAFVGMRGVDGSACCIRSHATVARAADGVDTWRGRNEVDRTRGRADAREGRASRNNEGDRARRHLRQVPQVLPASSTTTHFLQPVGLCVRMRSNHGRAEVMLIDSPIGGRILNSYTCVPAEYRALSKEPHQGDVVL